jgi:hypothetical protein
MIVNISTYLKADSETIAEYVRLVKTWRHVSWPIIKILPCKSKPLPEEWAPGHYQVWLFAFGVIPLGIQNINVEVERASKGYYIGRDKGSGWITKVWDPRIILKAEGIGTSYTDNVRIDAGVLTPIVWAFAIFFYYYRQRRWHPLKKEAILIGNLDFMGQSKSQITSKKWRKC